MIKVTTYKMLIKQLDVKIFMIIVLKINQLIIIFKKQSQNAHKFF